MKKRKVILSNKWPLFIGLFLIISSIILFALKFNNNWISSFSVLIIGLSSLISGACYIIEYKVKKDRSLALTPKITTSVMTFIFAIILSFTLPGNSSDDSAITFWLIWLIAAYLIMPALAIISITQLAITLLKR